VLAGAIEQYLNDIYEDKLAEVGPEIMGRLEGQVMLRIMDSRWMAHLQDMDYLRTGIGLRGYGQRDPLTEYREEAYNAFSAMTGNMYEDYLRTLLRLQVAHQPAEPEPEEIDPLAGKRVSYSNPEANLAAAETPAQAAPDRRAQAASAPKPHEPSKPTTYVKDKDDPYANVGRNDPCPCGSGKKFKKCHGMYQ
jgi:preprotein translocase subunit SecA